MVSINDENDQQAYDELQKEILELRRIAGLNIFRASVLLEKGEEDLCDMMLREAAVMMTVCHHAEQLLK